MPSNATGKIIFDFKTIIEQNLKDFSEKFRPKRDLARFFRSYISNELGLSTEAS